MGKVIKYLFENYVLDFQKYFLSEQNCKNLFLKKIDYIKIDTEGHDYKVLLGAKKFIKKHKPKFIQFEMNYHYLFSGENLYQFTDS